MKFPLALLAVAACAHMASADILISQYYEGFSNNKWIELTNTDPNPVSLDGFVLTAWNNASTESWKSGGGSPNNLEDLSGFSIPGNGFFLIANAAAVLPAYAVGDLESSTTFINGDDSLVLYDTALGLVGDTAAIVDALPFTDAGREGGEISFYRLTNGVGYDLIGGSSVLDFPSVWGSKSPGEVDDAQPGEAWRLENFGSVATDSLSVSLSVSAVAENAGAGVVEVTVTRTGSSAAALSITITSSDGTEALIPTPDREIPAGQASATFSAAIDAVDDSLADGTQTVTITAKATGLTDGTAELQVTDDGDVQDFIINEILARPSAGPGGDSNQDGVTDFEQDEFIEFVNVSAAPIDLAGWEVHDGPNPVFSQNPAYLFQFGTVLEPGCAFVVFGGGTTDFLGGTAQYAISNGFGPFGNGLGNNGDTVTVFDDTGAVVAQVDYGPEAGGGSSITRDPELAGPFVLHTEATNGGGQASSPGNQADGSLHCPGIGELSIFLSASTMSESGGSIIATVSRTGDLSAEVDVLVRLSDSSEATVGVGGGATVIVSIAANEASVPVAVDSVDDQVQDGTQTVALSAVAIGYQDGRTSFEVEDDGDGAFTAFIINEVLSDPPPGADPNRDGTADTSQDEFVELINVSGDAFDLSGFEIHDGFGLRHVFPAGSIVGDGQPIIVFGGGTPLGTFNGSVVQVASTGALGFNNGGDSVTLYPGGGGIELVRFEYDGSASDQSMTRDPDIIGGFVVHGSATGANGALFSPGTKVDGSIFDGGTRPSTILLLGMQIDFTSNDITVQVAGLQPLVEYSFDASLDLGDTDLWPQVEPFTTEDGTEVAPGVLEFIFNDSFIEIEDRLFYRISQP